MAATKETILERFVTEFVVRGDARRARAMGTTMERLGKSMKAMAGPLIGLGAALSGGMIGAASAFMSFEQGMDHMATQTGKNVKDLERDYGAAIRNIAKTTGIGFREIQQGFQKGISAGVEGEQLIAGVLNAAKGQAAGVGLLTDLISSATTATAVLGKETAAAMDTITMAAQRGEGDPLDYGQALKGVIGIAPNVGATFDDIAAAIANVAQASKSVPEGETQVKAFLQGVAKPSEMAKKILQEQKAAFDWGDIRKVIATSGLGAGVTLIQQYIEDLKASGKDTAPILGRMFRSIEAVTFLGTVKGENISALSRELRDSSKGTIDKEFQVGENSLYRVLAKLRVQFSLLITEIGEKLKPTLIDIANVLEEGMTWWEEQDEWLKSLVAHAMALGPLMLAVGTAFLVATPIFKAFGAVAATAAAALRGLAAIPLLGMWVGTDLHKKYERGMPDIAGHSAEDQQKLIEEIVGEYAEPLKSLEQKLSDKIAEVFDISPERMMAFDDWWRELFTPPTEAELNAASNDATWSEVGNALTKKWNDLVKRWNEGAEREQLQLGGDFMAPPDMLTPMKEAWAKVIEWFKGLVAFAWEDIIGHPDFLTPFKAGWDALKSWWRGQDLSEDMDEHGTKTEHSPFVKFSDEIFWAWDNAKENTRLGIREIEELWAGFKKWSDEREDVDLTSAIKIGEIDLLTPIKQAWDRAMAWLGEQSLLDIFKERDRSADNPNVPSGHYIDENGKIRRRMRYVPGITGPLPAAPLGSPTAAGAGGAPVNVNIGQVSIEASGATADELYRDASQSLQRQIRTAFETADSLVAY